ncbi:Histidine kinase [Lutibacter oricola]|uniref:Histidine kinase n=1 Tax=Lutibacter oricola TaxID=762486 RepID=A0A1H2W0J2_9FLAO|nr:histidine kinase [Lutibacter oricola]SDW73619.1 Histidine kinase [Lutibacter oricola]
MKFLLRVKKHQQYLYISIILIVIFFLGNALITPKITLVTENLIEDIVIGNLKSKQNIVDFEFNQLNSFLIDSEKIIANSEKITDNNLKEKLLFTNDLAVSNNNINNSFVCFLVDEKIEDIVFSENANTEYKREIINLIKVLKLINFETSINDVVNKDGNVYNRKIIAKELANGKIVVTGYDINLLSFWKYFSENYKGEGGYTVLTDTKGICVLHPETDFIGKPLNSFFENISINKVLNNNLGRTNFGVNQKELIKDKVTSEFLGLEVLRYYNSVKVGKSYIILIVSFPVDIYLKESLVNIKRYFSWISMLAFCIFMLLLAVSRFQLRKEFSENLKIVKEKDHLVNTNEKYQRENAVLQLNQLKKKMNPHFLFNSLNSLHVLIDSNKELSQKFVLKLADVYRYLLDDRSGNLISVKNELEFLKQYIFLQEIRFKSSLKVSIVDNSNLQSLIKKIPFLSLETLVENAIKHNEFTKQKPLFIDIIINSKEIEVVNNYNPRKTKDENSHHIGLNYLKNSYEYYQINSFKTEVIDDKFKCFLPLLS